jgi:tetratricopeptide (TPR) repeat protein
MHRQWRLLGVFFSLFFCSFVFAEVIHLKSGKNIEGKIREKTDKYISVEAKGTSLRYYWDEIESIEGEKPIIAPKQTVTVTQHISAAEAAFKRGLEYYGKNMNDEAIINFSKAIELDPNYAQAYANRAVAYAKKGFLDRAMADSTRAVALNPKDAQSYNNRGLVYYHLGELNQAILNFSKAIELDPRQADFFYNRGLAFYGKNNFDQAIADYSEAIELKPKDVAGYNNRAVAYFFKKDYNAAWKDVHKAEALGYVVYPKFIEELKKASGREK